VAGESEPQEVAGASVQFKEDASAGSLVVAVIGSAALPESTVGAVVGEVMLTAIGLTVRPRVAVLLESVADVTVTVAVQVVVSEVGAV
jgi:hypothetical protein